MVDATYSWYTADSQTKIETPNPVVSPLKDTIFTMVVTTSCGASAASVKVIVTH